MIPKYRTLFLLLLPLAILGCDEFNELEDIESVEYDASIALPLVNSTTNVQELLEDFEDEGTILMDPDGTIRLRYVGDPISEQGIDIFEDITNSVPPAFPVPTDSFALPFQIPGEIDIDQLSLKGGGLAYTFENPSSEPITVTVTLPQFLQEGEPITFDEELPGYGGSGPRPVASNTDNPINLAGVDIIPENDSIYVTYDARTESGDVVLLQNFLIGIRDLELSYAQGYLGQSTFEGGADTIEIDFFRTYVDGEIQFADPQVSLLVTNSFGVPTRSRVNRFEILTVEGNIETVESQLIDDGIDFPFPPLTAVGESRTETFVFDQSNSNVDEVLNAGPVEVYYDVDAITHPDGDTSRRGFITDSSSYEVQVQVDLPLTVQIDNFELRDTFEININDVDEVESAEFKIVTDNAIPLDIDVQAFFLDNAGNVLDSLLMGDQRLVAGAPTDAQGLPTAVNSKTTLIPYSAERFDLIRDATNIILVADFSTDSNPDKSVQVLSTQDLNVRIGAILNVVSE